MDTRKHAKEVMRVWLFVSVFAFCALYAWWPLKDWDQIVLQQVLPTPQAEVTLPYRDGAVVDIPVNLGVVVVNPMVDPVRDERLMIEQPATVSGLYVMQTDCSRVPGRVVSQVGKQTYVVRADNTELRRLTENQCVHWLDVYLPEYKLSETLQSDWASDDAHTEPGNVSLSMVIDPGLAIDNVIDRVYEIDSQAEVVATTQLPGQHVLVVETNFEYLPALANMKEVLWMDVVE